MWGFAQVIGEDAVARVEERTIVRAEAVSVANVPIGVARVVVDDERQKRRGGRGKGGVLSASEWGP